MSLRAADIIAHAAASLVAQDEIQAIVDIQEHMSARFEKTNAKLEDVNAQSVERLAEATLQFQRYTRVLTDAKKDLHSIFRRIRSVLFMS